MTTLNSVKGVDPPCLSPEKLGTVVLLTGLGRLLKWERMESLETQVLLPVLSCPPLSSRGPGVPICKVGSQGELVSGPF